MLVKEYKRDIDRYEKELLQKMSKIEEAMQIDDEVIDIESKMKREYEQNLSQRIRKKANGLDVDQGKKLRGEQSNINRLLRHVEKEGVREGAKEKGLEYSDSEDEASYGQYGSSFYTKIQPDEELQARRAQLRGAESKNGSIEHEIANLESTMNGSVQVGMKNL